MENETLSQRGTKIRTYALMESRDYFIFYLTANQASLIRKKDVDDLDAFREFIVQKFKGRYKKI